MDKMDKGEKRSGIEAVYIYVFFFFLVYSLLICQTKTLVLSTVPFISEWKDANSGQRDNEIKSKSKISEKISEKIN